MMLTARDQTRHQLINKLTVAHLAWFQARLQAEREPTYQRLQALQDARHQLDAAEEALLEMDKN